MYTYIYVYIHVYGVLIIIMVYYGVNGSVCVLILTAFCVLPV